jgi:hypothetical protein
MFIDHPLYKQAYLVHEIESASLDFCKSKTYSSPIIQTLLKKNLIKITIKLDSSAETTDLKLNDSEYLEYIKTHLEQKKLWNGDSLELVVKLK